MAKKARYAPSLDQADLFDSPDRNSTGWTPPMAYPRLTGTVALDLETKDPQLKTNGPGWPTGAGYPVGVSLATKEWAQYWPTRHAAGGNLDAGQTWRWLRDQLKSVDTLVLQNAKYDLGWLRTVGITELPKKIIDTQSMAALIDENRRSYSLQSLGTDYIGAGKQLDHMTAYAKRWGISAEGDDIWRMPPFIVGPYAEQDARLTYDLAEVFAPLIVKDDLQDVLALEMDLIPVLLDMRAAGVRIDVDGMARLRDQLLEQEADIRERIHREVGTVPDPWDADAMGTALGRRGVRLEHTDAGAVSITKEFLAECHDPVAQMFLELRRVNKLRTTFVEGSFMSHLQGDRIYPEFHPLRSERGGAVTGRFSSTNPNAQFLPARREEEARMIRGLVIAEAGQVWYAADYSQQEPRMLVHFASLMDLTGAREAMEAYQRDPKTDFHQFVSDLTGLKRKIAKEINLGKFYGMGGASFARKVGLPVITGRDGREYAGPEAQALLDQYDAKMPFVKEMYDLTQGVARRRGYIRTIAGRRRRFQPIYDPGASPHKALNAVIQGSSADQNKRAMIALHREKLTPRIVVHDEIDGSCDPDQTARVREIMQDCLPLRVPSVVDIAVGTNWGEAA